MSTGNTPVLTAVSSIINAISFVCVFMCIALIFPRQYPKARFLLVLVHKTFEKLVHQSIYQVSLGVCYFDFLLLTLWCYFG